MSAGDIILAVAVTVVVVYLLYDFLRMFKGPEGRDWRDDDRN